MKTTFRCLVAGKPKQNISVLRKQQTGNARTTTTSAPAAAAVGPSVNKTRSPSKANITTFLLASEMPDDSPTIASDVDDVAKQHASPRRRKLESDEQPLNDIANLSGHRIFLSDQENVKAFEDGQLENKEECVVIRSPKKQMSPSSAISKLTISTAQPKVQPKTQVRRRLNVAPPSRQLTDYFPVRRSERKCHSNILKEKRQRVEEALRTGLEEGLKVENFVGKGRGIVATRDFNRGDFVVEYSGELIDINEAKVRERLYAADENTGCYMYYFLFNNKQYCVDATAESKKMGRLVNHSRQGNLITKTIVVDSVPRLILVAKRDIPRGEELLYDYGDRSKRSLTLHPWLAT